jgi:hypothetical protein
MSTKLSALPGSLAGNHEKLSFRLRNEKYVPVILVDEPV